MSAGTGKTYDEGNVHVARWRREFRNTDTAALLALWALRIPRHDGSVSAWHRAIQNELTQRGVTT